MIELNTDRACDGCTKCCQGWLTGTAYGYEFHPQKPCHFLGKTGCNIYAVRPASPCKSFKCVWKTDKDFPIEFKPDKINAIFVMRELKDYTVIDVVEAGSELSNDVLNYIIQNFQNQKYKNIRYRYKGKLHILSNNNKFIEDNK